MYKLVLVDDESDIREGLMEVVPFEQLGFTVVGQASNGLEALQLCEKLAPDLVVTDIRMPLMDGLTLCRRLHALLPTTCFIILSGYDDFEYARQAIAFKSLDYLLKPISSPEFTQALTQARLKMDEERALLRDVTRLRAYFNESLPLLREMFLSGLLSGGMDARVAAREAARYELTLSAPQYVAAVLRLPEGERAQEFASDAELLKLAVINILRETLAPLATAYVFHFEDMIAALLLLPDESEAAFSQAHDAMEQARKTIEHYMEMSVAIGLGAPCYRLEDLHVCARQAVSALDQNLLRGGGETLCASDLEPGAHTELTVNEAQLRQLGSALKMADRKAARDTLSAMLTACAASQPTPQSYRAYLLEILLTLIRAARDMNIEMDIIGGANEGMLRTLMRGPDVEKAEATLTGLTDRLCAQIQEGRAGASAQLVHQAEDYLAAHYAEEDLSVERLCRHLHISPSYFSALFKRERKVTFHQALTALRMDRAMTLLTSTEQRTSEVAAAVGIPDPSYFSYAFKHYFGVSPSQARAGKGGRA